MEKSVVIRYLSSNFQRNTDRLARILLAVSLLCAFDSLAANVHNSENPFSEENQKKQKLAEEFFKTMVNKNSQEFLAENSDEQKFIDELTHQIDRKKPIRSISFAGLVQNTNTRAIIAKNKVNVRKFVYNH